MPDTVDRTLLKRFYNKLADRPLEHGDSDYVPYLETSGHDPFEIVLNDIDFSETSTVHLITGQRGNGKSTELLRLKARLTESGSIVMLANMRNYMSMTEPVEITDFMIALMVALSDEAGKLLDTDLSYRGLWERFTDFLQREVELKEFNFSAGSHSISAALRDNPGFKVKLQTHLRDHVEKLMREAHDFAAGIVEALRTAHNKPDLTVVFIIDSLEQIRGIGAEGDTNVYNSMKNLFVSYPDKLAFSTLHMVYTIPPYVIPLAPALGRYYEGSATINLPSLHVCNRSGENDPHALATMAAIIAKREPNWEKVLNIKQLERLALASGGDLRDFMRLIRYVLVAAPRSGSLPVNNDVITEVENNLRREMLPIAEADKAWLQKIAESHNVNLSEIDNLPQLARFFDARLIFNYRNGDDWYDVHPLLREEINHSETPKKDV